MKLLSKPSFLHESLLWEQGYSTIAGVDEVGRGAFAGPIVAAAVILPKDFSNDEINDSKLLTKKQREKLASLITNKAVCYSIADVTLPHINKYGIGRSNQLAFFKALSGLSVAPEFTLVDAFWIKRLKKKLQKPIVKGDQISLSIAAASIIAKVHRDKIMEKYAASYPQYRFERNKGYGTADHRSAIKQFGLCPLHRMSFNLRPFT